MLCSENLRHRSIQNPDDSPPSAGVTAPLTDHPQVISESPLRFRLGWIGLIVHTNPDHSVGSAMGGSLCGSEITCG